MFVPCFVCGRSSDLRDSFSFVLFRLLFSLFAPKPLLLGASEQAIFDQLRGLDNVRPGFTVDVNLDGFLAVNSKDDVSVFVGSGYSGPSPAA